MLDNIQITYLNHRIDISKLPIVLSKEEFNQQAKEADEPRGELEKKWIAHNHVNKLAKFNSDKYQDQDLIELLMYKLYSLIGIKSMPVELGYEEEDGQIIPCCLATDIVKKELGNEMIMLETAFYEQAEKNQTLSYSMSIEDSITAISDVFSNLPNNSSETAQTMKIDYLNMLLSDYLFDNPDRHLNNFAVIYNQFSKLYHFSDLFDNGLCFDGFKDQYFRYHAGFRQFPREEYINNLIVSYYHLLLPLINRINSTLTSENILTILSEPEFQDLTKQKKQYIYETIVNNLTLMNQTIAKYHPNKDLLVS